jgi:DNA-binding NarL/FixJ family response regulator
MSLRICCIDDSHLCIHGLQRAISETPHSIVATYSHLRSLQPHLVEQPTDVVITEVRVGGSDSIEYCSELLEQFPKTKLILYSYDENPTHVARASAIDAWEFVPKRAPVRRLVEAIEAIADQQRPKGSLIDQAKLFLRKYHKPAESMLVPLTKREHQILVHLALGLSNREISKSLSISLETVKEHVQNVLRKLQTTDRTAAAIWSLRNGIPTLHLDMSDPPNNPIL